MQTKLLRPVQGVLSAALLVVVVPALAACGSGTGAAGPSATPSASPSGGASSFAAYAERLAASERRRRLRAQSDPGPAQDVSGRSDGVRVVATPGRPLRPRRGWRRPLALGRPTRGGDRPTRRHRLHVGTVESGLQSDVQREGEMTAISGAAGLPSCCWEFSPRLQVEFRAVLARAAEVVGTPGSPTTARPGGQSTRS